MSRIDELKEDIPRENMKIKDEIKEINRQAVKFREIGARLKEELYEPLKTYQFFNHTPGHVGHAGRPFALCQLHLVTQKIPPNCSLKELSTEDSKLFWGTMTPTCDRCRIENFYEGKERRNG